MSSPQRFAVVGSGGSGKSTFARKLSELTGLPAIHLDEHYWKPGWVETSRDDWIERQRELLAGDRWIADGNYGGTVQERMTRADTVIVLQLSRWLCLWRITKRTLFDRSSTQAPGCPHRISLEFYRYVWSYPTGGRARMNRSIEAQQATGTCPDIVRLTSRRAVRSYLDALR